MPKRKEKPPVPPETSALVGRELTFNKRFSITIGERIGQGGFGAVHFGRGNDGLKYVIKIVRLAICVMCRTPLLLYFSLIFTTTFNSFLSLFLQECSHSQGLFSEIKVLQRLFLQGTADSGIVIVFFLSSSTHTHTHIYIYTHTHTHIYIYIYIHSHTHTHTYIHTLTHTPLSCSSIHFSGKIYRHSRPDTRSPMLHFHVFVIFEFSRT